ncbi:MAG: Mur ligase domain-containing protein [Candidatus Pacebacteria bacterium]|nr:Mur ligase domain-containing protein [Candidatus Paceibacterota bacterium]
MKIHFIGIGGIGISALAGYYLKKGAMVSGSDLSFSETTNYLKKQGAKIINGHKIQNIKKDLDLVIYSPAVKKENPEYKRAKELKIPLKSYPQALGQLTKKYFTIAVSGTHGKSTTCSMIALLLEKAGFDPTVIVGTKLKEFSNLNFRVGKSKYLVIEADEHFASFLNYSPDIIILTNIEKEHLDYYKNFKNILKTFKKYIKKLPKNGLLIINKDIKIKALNVIKYGQRRIKLKIPGKHNQLNASAALTLARYLRIPDKISLKVLAEYNGCWRRFEQRKYKKLIIISDYAHHPTEVRETLKAAREKFKQKNIWCIFQPHQYQRTYYFFNDFIKTFKFNYQDNLIITDVFEVEGRENENIKKKVNIQKLAKKAGGIYLTQDKIGNYLKNNIKNNSIIIFMGAGNIYLLADKIFPK